MSRNSEIKTVTLPYDFIPFPKEEDNSNSTPNPGYYYPYSRQNEGKQLPRHDRDIAGHLSGYLTYKVDPKSPLTVELRETTDGEGNTTHWMSGSTVRGKLYSNVEILSASYPAFIDDSDLLYRDLSDAQYRERLGVKDDCKLEQAVEAGYLYRNDDGGFYIVPAADIGDYHFLSVRELDIWNKWRNMISKENCLFRWDDTSLKEMSGYAERIAVLDEAIYSIRQNKKAEVEQADAAIKIVFTKGFSFTKRRRELNAAKDKNKRESVINDLRKELREALASKIKGHSLTELLNKMEERWELKLRMHLKYQEGSFQKSGSFPYQKEVSYVAQGRNVNWIGDVSSSRAGAIKGMLFNSTNASSKRSHYLIGKEREESSPIIVPDRTIAAYNSAFGRIRLSEGNKAFYDLFNIQAKTNDGKPKVVFFKRRESKGKLEELVIGRTPYFRIQHQFQLSELRGNRQQDGIDYARALFGYIAPECEDQSEGQEGYKSRIRFSPLRVCGSISSRRTERFLLAKPQPTAQAMYLKPFRNKPSSYEGNLEEKSSGKEERTIAPRLRGRKYYHVLHSFVPYTGQDNDNMSSERHVYDPSFNLEGALHFKNLTEAELGLLILAMDIRLLPEYSGYRIDTQKEYYELIGGAKAYGYGKVQFKVEGIQVERKDNSFESLVLQPYESKKVDPAHYVRAFLDAQGGAAWLDRIHMKCYVESRLERNFSSEEQRVHVNWENLQDQRKLLGETRSGGGYPKEWMLKDSGD